MRTVLETRTRIDNSIALSIVSSRDDYDTVILLWSQMLIVAMFYRRIQWAMCGGGLDNYTFYTVF